jgi:hypothetical protein
MDWVVMLLLAVVVMLWWIRAAIEPIREYFHEKNHAAKDRADDAEFERIRDAASRED